MLMLRVQVVVLPTHLTRTQGKTKILAIIGAFLEAAQCSCNGEASFATVQVIIILILNI